MSAEPRQERDDAGRELLVIASDRFADHHPPQGHPERPERAQAMTRVAQRWRESGGAVGAVGPAGDEDLGRVHAAEYVREIGSTSGRTVRLDADTYTSPASEDVARLAAGAAIGAVDHALAHASSAMALVRPPGHHAERDRAMGFCLYNNVAVAAAYARSCGVGSVAVVDYDVHHGNGTQWIFYDDPTVLFLSTHQYPFYPGTGAITDVGTGAGTGFTVNLALAAGAGDADYRLLFEQAVLPVLDAFSPSLVLLSAGYDAHTRDPLGGMNVSTAGYLAMTRMLRDFADARCGGRLVAVTEGGYDLVALEECLDGTIRVLAEAEDSSPQPAFEGTTERAEATLARLRQAQGRYWPTL